MYTLKQNGKIVAKAASSQELRISWGWAAYYPELYLTSTREFAETHPAEGWTITMETLGGHVVFRAEQKVDSCG